MRFPFLATLLAAATLTFSPVLGSGTALAQGSPVTQPVKPTMPYKSSGQTTQKKAPGKTCGDLAPNSQAHKDCIAKQAKSDQGDKAKAKAKKKSS